MHARHKGRFIKRAEKLRREKCADIVRDLRENDRVDEVHEENNADIDSVISKGVTSDDSNVAIQWNEGRRVVELGVLANGLRACQECGEEFGVEFDIALTEVFREGGISEGFDISEEDMQGAADRQMAVQAVNVPGQQRKEEVQQEGGQEEGSEEEATAGAGRGTGALV